MQIYDLAVDLGARVFTSKEIAEFTRESLEKTEANDLAYLAVTGKIELPIRDALGAWITKKFPNLTAAREYKRRDLVLLEDGTPITVIEGKLWISFEANFPNKLHNLNSKDGLVTASMGDIAKMRELSRTTGCEMFISTALFAADIRELDNRHLPAIKYPNWHRRGLAGSISLDEAHNQGVVNYLEAVTQFGSCASVRLFEGQVFDMRVLADVVICKIES
jgi:hypothetical protein